MISSHRSNMSDDADFKNKRVVRDSVRVAEITLAVITFLMITGAKVVKLRSVPAMPELDATWARFFIELALYLYFLSWIFGARSDLKAQEHVTRDLEELREPLWIMLFVSAALLVGAFAALWLVKGFVTFAVTLAVFLAIDVGASIVYYGRLVKQFERSRVTSRAKNNLLAIREVDVVERFTVGRWRKWRWGVRFGVLAVLVGLHGADISDKIAAGSPALTGDAVDGLGVLLYVVVFELWIWGARLRRDARLSLLHDITAEADTKVQLTAGNPVTH